MNEIELNKYHCAILRKMLYKQRPFIGKHWTTIEGLVRGFPSHEIGNIKKAIEDLIRWGFLGQLKAHGQVKIFIIPEKVHEIRSLFESKCEYSFSN